jgi:hypothetical protein
MKKEDARLKAEIEALLQRAEQVDAEEDALYGVGKQPQDLPAELQRREGRRAKIREALGALKRETAKARAAEHTALADDLRTKADDPGTSLKKQGEFETLAAQHDQQAADLDDDDPPPPAVDSDLPRNTPPKTPSGEPKPKAQRNFTDPDSRIMFKDGTYVQAYNGQIAVDEGHQIIVAAALSNQGTDAEYFEPMLRRVVDNCDRSPEKVTGDAAYFSAANLLAAAHLGSEPFLSVGGHRRNGLPDDQRMATNLESSERAAMRTVLSTDYGRAAYARRKATVEPVFGQIRSARRIQQMSFRGLLKNRLEWLLICATHNVLKLWRARRSALVPA